MKEHAWKLLGYLPRVSELYFKYLQYLSCKLVFSWIVQGEVAELCKFLESVDVLIVLAHLYSPLPFSFELGPIYSTALSAEGLWALWHY